MTFVSAQYVKMPHKGEVTTDHWVVARHSHEAGTTLTLPHDSDLDEWQQYLADGGTIEPYEETSLEPQPQPVDEAPLPPRPGPVLSDLYPPSMPADSHPFELMLWGDNFSMGSIVLFSDEKVSSIFLNHHQILATLSGGTWRKPGDYTVRVVAEEENLANKMTDELQFTFVAPAVQLKKGE